MDYQALGQRMRGQRERLKLTQEQAASLAGITTSFYGHVERGTRIASIQTLLALAQVLQTTPDRLLDIGIEYNDSAPAEIMESIDSMRSLLDQMEAYYNTPESRKKRTRSHIGERGS